MMSNIAEELNTYIKMVSGDNLIKEKQSHQSIHDILQDHPKEVDLFKRSPETFNLEKHPEFYKALFDLYNNSGEMPHQVVKASSERYKAQWVWDKLRDELSGSEPTDFNSNDEAPYDDFGMDLEYDDDNDWGQFDSFEGKLMKDDIESDIYKSQDTWKNDWRKSKEILNKYFDGNEDYLEAIMDNVTSDDYVNQTGDDYFWNKHAKIINDNFYGDWNWLEAIQYWDGKDIDKARSIYSNDFQKIHNLKPGNSTFDSRRRTTEAEDEGVSAEDLVDIITHRIKQDNNLMLKLLGNEGPGPLMNAIENVADFYSGTTEVGSSDVSAMVDAVVKQMSPNESVSEDEDEDGDRLVSNCCGEYEDDRVTGGLEAGGHGRCSNCHDMAQFIPAKEFYESKGKLDEIDPSRSPWTKSGKHPGAMNQEELEKELEVFDELQALGFTLSTKEMMQRDSLNNYLYKQDDVEEDQLDEWVPPPVAWAVVVNGLAVAVRVGGAALKFFGKKKVTTTAANTVVQTSTPLISKQFMGGVAVTYVWTKYQDFKDWIGKWGLDMDDEDTSAFAKIVVKYGIPAGAVIAILYGGKKLKDYLTKNPEYPGKTGNTTINNYYSQAPEPEPQMASKEIDHLKHLSGI